MIVSLLIHPDVPCGVIMSCKSWVTCSERLPALDSNQGHCSCIPSWYPCYFYSLSGAVTLGVAAFFLSLLININFSITTYKNLSCNYMNCFYFILIFNCHVRSSSRPDLFRLFPPGGDDRRGLCGDTNPGSTPKGGGCICVCVLVQYMKASHLLRQGCKLAPHLLPQLDQITFTLHPLSSPCVVPRSLYLSSIHPLLTHYLTLSWD